jgi:hypothetical protein
MRPPIVNKEVSLLNVHRQEALTSSAKSNRPRKSENQDRKVKEAELEEYGNSVEILEPMFPDSVVQLTYKRLADEYRAGRSNRLSADRNN